MAHVTSCPVCNQSVVDVGMHPECSVAVLSDLLLRIQEHLVAFPGKQLPDDLQAQITRGTFQSLEEFKVAQLARMAGHSTDDMNNLFDQMQRLHQVEDGPNLGR